LLWTPGVFFRPTRRLKSSSGASRQKRFGKLADIAELFEVINEIDQRIASAGTKRFLRKIEAASKFREMLLAREATRGTSQHDSAAPAVPSFSVMTTSCGTNAFGCMPVDITRDTRNVG
jgi:hypothetical protein